jgi:hypothetical protein
MTMAQAFALKQEQGEWVASFEDDLQDAGAKILPSSRWSVMGIFDDGSVAMVMAGHAKIMTFERGVVE